MKKDFVKRKSEEEEEENLEIQIDLTARFKLEKQLNCSEEEEEEEKNDIDTTKFNLARDLNCSKKKHEKNDSDTKKYEDLNCSEKSSSTVMEEEEEEEEERMKWRIEDDEYVCCICGLRGSKFLDHSFGYKQLLQDAHRYCVLKEIKDKSLEARDESLDGKVWRVELCDFFKILAERSTSQTSLIDHLVQKKLKN